MNNKKTTKRALISSILSLALCMTMLIGTTFAWFTDSVTSTNNIIKSGNLDVEMEYSTDMQNWNKVTDTTNVFKDGALWEPGYTEVVYLRISNVGSLALRYNLNINVASETGSINAAGKEFKLSDYIKCGVVDPIITAYADRNAARAAVNESAWSLNTPYAPETQELYPEGNADAKVSETMLALVVYMPEEVGNEANHASNVDAPVINLGINLFATQLEYEEDTFGSDYDKAADFVVEKGEIATFESEDLTGKVENNGTVNIIDSTITNNTTGVQNYGDATLTDVTINAGTPGYTGKGYAVNSIAGANTVLNNVTVNSDNGVIGATNGAQVTVNDGTYVLASANTSGRYVIYAVGEGTVVTINDGDFSIPAQLPNGNAQNMRRAYVYTDSGATVVINGGNFEAYKPNTAKGYSAIMGNGTVIITGGTFGFNPTNWLATGCEAIYDSNAKTWTVQPMSSEEANQAFKDAVTSGETDIALADGNYTMPTTTGDMTISGTSDTVITINKPTADNVTLKGVTVVGSGNYTGIQHSDKVVYENCIVKGVQFLYASEVEFINCTVDLTAVTDYIWTYGAKNVTFDKCTFNTNGKAILIYSEDANLRTNVTVKNCTFNATASALASGATAAAIEIDSSLATNGQYTLTTENNTVDSDFSGEWRIKKSGTNNTTVNGVVYNAITIDGVKQ